MRTNENVTRKLGGVRCTSRDQRADAVRDYLVKQGVEAGRLQSVAYGAMRPIDTNATKEGRAKNRRVELIVVD